MESVRLLFALRERNGTGHPLCPRLLWRHKANINRTLMSSSILAVFPAATSNPLSMSRNSPPKINGLQLHNRILALMAHTSRYAFQGETRLAHDAGVSKSAVSRLLRGHSNPSFALVVALTRALEKRVGRPLDPRDLISLDGHYPTATACELAGCKGCLPPKPMTSRTASSRNTKM